MSFIMSINMLSLTSSSQIDWSSKSLKFLSLEGLYTALEKGKRNDAYPQFSDHYFTGDYPIKPSDNLNNLKIRQLSLLSGKSNS